MNWTSRQEQRHAELQAELAELEAKREEARQRLGAILDKCFDRDYEGTSVDLLIRHADEMRDALEPFDSGIRVEPEKS